MARRQNGYIDVDDNAPFLSEYNKRYPVHSIEPRYNYKPSTQPVRVEEPMEVNTSNKLDYPAWDLPERKPRDRPLWNPPADPFGGESTAKGDFKGTYLPKQKSYKPDAKPFQSQDPLDAHTTTGVDYPAYEIQPRPRRQPQPYQKPDGRMEGNTLNRLNYPEHEIQPRQSYKPTPVVNSSGEPLDSTTTASLDYKPYQIEPRQPRERQKWVKPDGKMDGVTTSRSEYPQHELQPRENYKPAANVQKSNDPFKGDTTSKLDFPAHQIEPRRKRQAQEYIKPDGRMEDQTSNRRDYPQHDVSPTRSFKPQPVVQPSEPFDGETTARKEFKEHHIEPRKRREPAKYSRPEGKMDGVSTSRSEFPQHDITPRKSYKPDNTVQKSEDPFSKDTTTALSYPEYKIEPRQRKQAQPYVKPDGIMDGISTNAAEFPRHELQARENFKPPNNVVNSNEKFDDQTTARLNYPEHPVEPRQKRQQVQYTGPEGAFDGTTSNRQDYPVHELTPRETFKPANSVQQSTEPFDHKTSQNLDYPAYDIEPRKRREQQKYVKPDGKIDGVTTNRAEFPQHELTPRKSYKPDNSYQMSTDPSEKFSTTRREYPEHKIEPRQVRQPEPYRKPDGKIDGVSTNRAEFPQHELQPRHSYKPDNKYEKSSVPFDDTTLARINYPEHPIEPRQKRQQVQYTGPEGDFDGTTSNRQDYPVHELTPRETFKPANSVQQSTDPFDHKTSQNLDYPAYDIEPRKRREQQKYVKPDGKIDGVTTNRAEFPQHELTPRKSYKPDNSYQMSTDPSEKFSTTRREYPEHKIEPRQVRQPEPYRKPDGKIDGVSTNRAEFPQHELQPRHSYKPDNKYEKSSVPFDDTTLARLNYPEHPIEPRQKRQQVQYTGPDGAFDGTTSNRQDYPVHELTPRETFKPANSVQRSTEPFDHKTSQNLDYPAYDIEPRKRREQQKYVKPDGKIDGVTTNRAEFPQHELTQRQPFKPSDSYLKSDDRFNGDTVSRLDYQEYPIEARQTKPAQQYVPPEGKMEVDTSNRLDYPTHQLQPRMNYKPANEVQKAEGKFEGTTTTEQDYPAHVIEPRQTRQQVQYTGPEGDFDGTTSNRQDYPVHELTPRETFKPANSVQRSTEPFDHKTSQNLDYPAYDIEPRKKREQQKYVKPDGKIDGVTTNRAEFPQHELTPRHLFKPNDSYVKSDDPFNGDTTFRSNYPEHPIEARTVKTHEPYIKPEGVIEGDTTNRLDYREYEIKPRQSFKPVSSVENSKEPFNGDTTTRSEYPAHDIEPRKVIDRHQYVKPEGDMEKMTSNQLDYRQHDLTPRETFKPKDSVQQSDVPFDCDTTSRRDFKQHDITPRQKKDQAKYVKPEGKFEGDTTNHADFPTHELKPTQSCRPSNEPMLSQDPFDGSTTSRRDYGEHKIEPRQAVQQDMYKKPEGEIDFNTINKLNFVETVPQREMLKRPESSHIMERGAHFEGNTRYAEDFKGHEITPREVLNKNENYRPPTVPMETMSSARLDYQQHELPKQEVVRPKEAYSSPKIKFDGTTTNADSYKGEFVPKTQSFKPNGEPLQSGAPFDDTTTSKRDFQQHQVEPRKVITGKPYEKPEGLMYLNTTSKEAFTPKSSPRDRVMRPESSHLMNRNNKFEGSSNYGSDFVQHDVQPRELINKSQDYNPPNVSMETSTINKLTFTQHPIEKTQNFKPAAVVEKPPPFEGKTGYSDTFVGHQIPQKEVRPKPTYETPRTKFEGTTTTSDSFKGVSAPKQQSYRPSNAPFNSGAPLDDRTTAKQDFKEHKVERRHVVEKAQYAKPDGGFDFNTTNKLTFTPKKTSRSTPTKPGSSGVMGRGGQFEGSTNYGSDFQSHEVTPRTLVKKSNDYTPPAIPMVTETTNKKDFTKPVLGPRQPYKPVPMPQISKEPFAGSTGYRESFKEFEVPRKMVKTKNEYNPPKVPFNGTTTNRQDFTGTTASKRDAFKPVENTFQSKAPLESSTTSKRDFGSHPVERREVAKRAQWVKPEGRMELQTTNNDNFKQPAPIGRNSAPRPKSSGILKFGGKIEGITNYSSDFIQREGGGRPGLKGKTAYVPNPHPFQGTTTNRSDFTQRDGVKATSFKPLAVPFSSNARFDNSTTYSADFTKSAPPWMTHIPDPIAVGGPIL